MEQSPAATAESPEMPGRATSRDLFRFRSYDAARRAALAAEFVDAKPFRHVVVDDFLAAPANEVTVAFPDTDWPDWAGFDDAYQHNKRYCGDIARLPPLFQAMVHDLSGPDFLGFLEEMTGIRGLLPDPYLVGGGLHSSGPGGILAPHADFHHYPRLDLYRRINVLVYFNPGWTAEFGGCLELYEKGAARPSCEVVPVYGRMVAFLTDDRSIHGFSRPISGTKRWRNSLALYYYTSDEAMAFSGDGTTHWQMHGTQSPRDFAGLVAYKGFLRVSRLFARLAHAANPNLRRGARSVSKAT